MPFLYINECYVSHTLLFQKQNQYTTKKQTAIVWWYFNIFHYSVVVNTSYWSTFTTALSILLKWYLNKITIVLYTVPVKCIFILCDLPSSTSITNCTRSFAVKPAIYLRTSSSRRNAVYASWSRVTVEIKHAQHDILAFIINYMVIFALKWTTYYLIHYSNRIR